VRWLDTAGRGAARRDQPLGNALVLLVGLVFLVMFIQDKRRGGYKIERLGES
jgi:hypothetical protein